MARRCLNDFFGYCTGEPDPTGYEAKIMLRGLSGRPKTFTQTITTCIKQPATCGLHQTATEHYQPPIQRIADGYLSPAVKKQNSHETTPPD